MMTQSTQNLPSAKATLESLRAELVKKGFQSTIDGLPALKDMVIESQHYCESEHPYKIYMGQRNSQSVYAVLGRKPVSADSKGTAPDMIFYIGTETLGSFKKLETVGLIEPFRSLWERTRDLQERGASRAGWDLRRGYFKVLVYWYYLQNAAERDVEFRFPETVRKTYVEKAFLRLSQKEVQERGKTEDVIIALKRMAGIEREQKEVEGRIREEGRKKVKVGDKAETLAKMATNAEVQEKIAALEEQVQQLKQQEDVGHGSNILSTTTAPIKQSQKGPTRKATPRKRLAETRVGQGGKCKPLHVEEENASEAQVIDEEVSIMPSIEEDSQPSTSRRHKLTTNSDTPTRETADNGNDTRASSEYEELLRYFNLNGPAQSDNKPIAISAPEPVDLQGPSVIHPNTGSLAYNEHTDHHMPLLNLTNLHRDTPVHSVNRPSQPSIPPPPPISSPPPTSTLSTTTHTPPLSMDTTVFINTMRSTLLKTEQLTADLASIQAAEAGLQKQKEVLEKRKKQVKEALRVNWAVIGWIADGWRVGVDGVDGGDGGDGM